MSDRQPPLTDGAQHVVYVRPMCRQVWMLLWRGSVGVLAVVDRSVLKRFYLRLLWQRLVEHLSTGWPLPSALMGASRRSWRTAAGGEKRRVLLNASTCVACIRRVYRVYRSKSPEIRWRSRRISVAAPPMPRDEGVSVVNVFVRFTSSARPSVALVALGSFYTSRKGDRGDRIPGGAFLSGTLVGG